MFLCALLLVAGALSQQIDVLEKDQKQSRSIMEVCDFNTANFSTLHQWLERMNMKAKRINKQSYTFVPSAVQFRCHLDTTSEEGVSYFGNSGKMVIVEKKRFYTRRYIFYKQMLTSNLTASFDEKVQLLDELITAFPVMSPLSCYRDQESGYLYIGDIDLWGKQVRFHSIILRGLFFIGRLSNYLNLVANFEFIEQRGYAYSTFALEDVKRYMSAESEVVIINPLALYKIGSLAYFDDADFAPPETREQIIREQALKTDPNASNFIAVPVVRQWNDWWAIASIADLELHDRNANRFSNARRWEKHEVYKRFATFLKTALAAKPEDRPTLLKIREEIVRPFMFIQEKIEKGLAKA